MALEFYFYYYYSNRTKTILVNTWTSGADDSDKEGEELVYKPEEVYNRKYITENIKVHWRGDWSWKKNINYL